MMKRYFATLLLLIGLSLTGSNTYALQTSPSHGEDFQAFLVQFTNSATFQLSRIKFPLKSPIILLSNDGETEKSFPFTKDKWPLLEEGAFNVERMEDEDGSVYITHYTTDEPTKKVFEAGFEESEIDMRVEFVLIDGKWFVVDGYTGWYGFDLPAEELKEAVKQVQEDNQIFKELHP